ncbi:hypothetical protein FN976_11360 [Caenimonas sedimenti]|uniref:Uncharacterized protein n=1 Tax=Caenimonas sedimenti TaxID=2596921 RepID=A0A562ZTN6_9BURK|nr:hypothetical protein [Caenimonas sedimenti]TWO71504.1 hypothetical protein FN976_11360 [Caenimonas sedimenti]
MHTHAGEKDLGLSLLGSVERGAAAGGLAVDSGGSYVQLNGDFITPLGNSSQLRRAVERAQRQSRAPYPRPSSASVEGSISVVPPLVIVRKRRTLVVA